jgi:putative glutamine amidotransferase
VRLETGSLAAAAAWEVTHTVHCHHQAVAELGDGLRVTARAQDEIVEAVELDAARFVLGLQWHPEAKDTSRVIGALARAASVERTTSV